MRPLRVPFSQQIPHLGSKLGQLASSPQSLPQTIEIRLTAGSLSSRYSIAANNPPEANCPFRTRMTIRLSPERSMIGTRRPA